jgi:hypothetical protein
MVQMDNGSVDQWKYGQCLQSPDRQWINGNMVQMDNDSMETMDPQQQGFTEASKE